ncbi:hypothetical protein G5I_05203 [Acromyrmex echinatior]|uniref:Uncharacterized protein n=1 Tax=Acromyrmex echinatior TaxID=103372 RepID=F4WHN5_ACREC|nr:hypothetical protein G5I_05203 [Acromyrmex echinatior]
MTLERESCIPNCYRIQKKFVETTDMEKQHYEYPMGYYSKTQQHRLQHKAAKRLLEKFCAYGDSRCLITFLTMLVDSRRRPSYLSGLATISATIRHITSASCASANGRRSLEFTSYRADHFEYKKKKRKQYEFAVKTYSALEELERKISHVHQSVQSQTQHDSSDAGSFIGSHEEVYPEI